MNEAGLRALYSVGLNGGGATSTSRSFSSLLVPSPSTVNAVSSTVVEANAGNGIEVDDSIETIEDVTTFAAASTAVATDTTSVAEKSLKSTLTSSRPAPTVHTPNTTSEKPGILVLAGAMFAARVYGAAERAGIVGNRAAHKSNRQGVDNLSCAKTRTVPTEALEGTVTQVAQAEEVKIAKEDIEKNSQALSVTENPGIRDEKASEDVVASIRARMDALLTERADDENYFAHELVSLQLALETAQHELASVKAENAFLRAGAMRDDAETSRLRAAVRAAERQALTLTFDVGTLVREGARQQGETARLEVELDERGGEAARAKALVDEMKERLEVLSNMQRLAGAALDMASVHQAGHTDKTEFLEPDPAQLGALARLANQRLDTSFVFSSDDLDQDEESMTEDTTDDLSEELATEFALVQQEQQQAQVDCEADGSANNSEDSVIIVTDMDANQSGAPLVLISKAIPIEQPRASKEYPASQTTHEQPDLTQCQPIPVYHTMRPSLPPKAPKAAPLNAPATRLRSKPSLQRMAIANARRVSDQKFKFATRSRGNVANERNATPGAGANASPRTFRLKPLLLAARFAAAASAAGRRRRANSNSSSAADDGTTAAENKAVNVSTAPPKALNPGAQEFTPRKSPTQPSSGAQLISQSVKQKDNKPVETTTTLRKPVAPLTLTLNPDANCTPRTTRAISVQILSARTACRERERELAQAKAEAEAGVGGRSPTRATRNRERERTTKSRVVSCPARPVPVRVRVSPRLPLALFAEIDPNSPGAVPRYQFRSVSLPSRLSSTMNTDVSAAPTAPRAVSMPNPAPRVNIRGKAESREVLASAQRRLERKTSSTFGEVGPSSYWRKRPTASTGSNSSCGYSSRAPLSSSPKVHVRRASAPKGSGSGNGKVQKARLIGKGRPRADARRGAFNELTNVAAVSRENKESGRWLSA